MTIRRRYELLSLLFAFLFFESCHKKDVTAPELSVSSYEELFTAAGGTSEVTVTSNTNWNINSLASWLTATPSTTNGNGRIFFNVQSNPTATERSAVLSVT